MRIRNQVLVIQIHVDFEVLQSDIRRIPHWNPSIEVAWRTGIPVFPQIREQIDVITDYMEAWGPK